MGQFTDAQLRAIAMLWDAASEHVEADQENHYDPKDEQPGPLLSAIEAMQAAFSPEHPIYRTQYNEAQRP